MDPTTPDLSHEAARYAPEAYDFVREAVSFTQDRLGRGLPADDRHVSGAELLRGACELAVREFGLMAPVVFRRWGIGATDDIGAIVFRLIELEDLSKSDRDAPDDFRGVFDLDKALADGFELTLDDARPRGGR